MSGSYPAEVLGCGSEGSGTEVSVSVTHPVEVLGCGSEESVAEVSVSVPHPAEVLECPADGSWADWTISVLSEFEIVLAAALTIAPVQRIGFLNVLMPVVSHFARHSRSLFLMDFTRTQWTDGHIRFGLGLGSQASSGDVFSVASGRSFEGLVICISVPIMWLHIIVVLRLGRSRSLAYCVPLCLHLLLLGGIGAHFGAAGKFHCRLASRSCPSSVEPNYPALIFIRKTIPQGITQVCEAIFLFRRQRIIVIFGWASKVHDQFCQSCGAG